MAKNIIVPNGIIKPKVNLSLQATDRLTDLKN